MECHREEEQLQQSMQRKPLLSGQGPWLVFLHGKREEKQTFYSVSEGRYFVKSIPDMRRKLLATCSHGWLVLVDKNSDECFLLNPVSMHKIVLPPLMLDFFYETCVLSSSPNDPNCVVMFFQYDWGNVRFTFCKPGTDIEWTRQDLNLPDYETAEPDASKRVHKDHVVSVGVHEGRIYMLTFCEKLYLVTVDHSGTVKLVDLEVGPRSRWIGTTNGVRTFLVETCGGELLLVDQSVYHDDVIDIRVFRMDFDRKVWVRKKRMKGHAIFSGSFGQVVACATEGSGIQENTIYFTSPQDRTLYTYNLDLCTFGTYLPCPNVKHDWSQPDWILPAP